MKKTIFISIAAYNEPDLVQTIKSALDMASHPDRLRFGVSCHYNDNNSPDLSMFNNLKKINIDYKAQLGCPPSRLNTFYLYDDEDYFLQIDAHMLFEENWDEDLVEAYENLKNYFEKPVISSYVPWWGREEDGSITGYNSNSSTSMPVLIPSSDLEYNKSQSHLMIYAYSHDYKDSFYKEHFLTSGHFIFCDKSFSTEILPDPLMLFGGEEPVLAIRLWTRGYRIFSINKAIAWHRNKFSGIKYNRDWRFDDRDLGELQKHYLRKMGKSLRRVKAICTGEIVGYWGAKDLESLKEYEKNLGVDFNKFYKEIGF